MRPIALQAGPDLLLRSLQPRDARELFAILDGSRARLRRWLPFVDATRAPQDTRAFVRAAMAQAATGVGHHFAVRWRGVLAGVVGYRQPERHPSVDVGYWLGDGFEGRGLITASCRALLGHVFAAGIHRVEIRAATGNGRSRAVPERLGFRLEGILREAEFLPDQGWVDHCVYGLTAGDWTRRRGFRDGRVGSGEGRGAPSAPLAPSAAEPPAEPPGLDAEMAAYYEARAPEYDEWYERRGRYADPARDGLWFSQLQVLHARVARFAAGLPPGATVLDAGCGTGRWTAVLAERRDVATLGLDRSAAMLGQAQARIRRLGLHAAFVLGDALALPLGDGSLDAAFAGFLFDHLAPDQRAAFLAELRRVVRPGGGVLVIDSRLEPRHQGEWEIQERVLTDGRRFRVRKGLFTAETLARSLGPLGAAEVGETPDFFVWGEVRR